MQIISLKVESNFASLNYFANTSGRDVRFIPIIHPVDFFISDFRCAQFKILDVSIHNFIMHILIYFIP